eukprot:PITA_10299
MAEEIVLGNTISQQGLQVDPNKIAIIQRVPPPQKVRDVRSFLGLAGYYRRFIKDFSKLASPLFGLLGKDAEFLWTNNCQEALDALKVTEKELLAVVHSLNKFRHYITDYQTFVHTDHAAIRYLMNKPDVNAHIIRWLILLQQFDLTIVDKPGKENIVADFLYRLYLPVGEEGMVDDQMPDEHLFSILVLSPWFADIANYLVSAQFPPHLSSKEKSKIVRKSAPFTWIGGNLFKLGPDQILR